MVEPKATRFKAMSWDEKVAVLEQKVQETIRIREKMISVEVVGSPKEAIETTEFSQETPVQNKNFPEVQDMRERGSLMYQHTLQMMGLMRDILDPIRLKRFLTDSPEESLIGLSDPNFVSTGNING
jgi:hypothetical protein